MPPAAAAFQHRKDPVQVLPPPAQPPALLPSQAPMQCIETQPNWPMSPDARDHFGAQQQMGE